MKKDLIHALASLQVDGLVLRLPPELDMLSDNVFKELKRSMTNIGGTWKTNKRGWVFKTDPTSFLDQLRSGKIINIFQDHQFFFTPDEATAFLVDWPECDAKLTLPSHLSSSKDIKFLEPSAGEGHIVDYISRRFARQSKIIATRVCENMPRNREILKRKGYEIIASDFLSLGEEFNGYFDLVIANPPFANFQYIQHIYKMYDVTKEGGTIYTVAPASYQDGNRPAEIKFREWLKSVHANIKPVPADLFRQNKAGVRCHAIWIDILYS